MKFTSPDSGQVYSVPVFGIVIGLLVLITAFSSFFTVGAGEVAVVTRLGRVTGIYDSGFHLKAPFFDSVKNISKKTQTVAFEEFPLAAASKDLQDVSVKVSVNYQVDTAHVDKFVTTYDNQYEEKIVRPIIAERVKTISARYTAEEAVTKRDAMSQDMAREVRESLAGKDVVVTAFNIIDIQFSEEFTKAIERKVTAQQDALTAENKKAVARAEADAALIRAEGNAKAAKITAEAVNNNGGDNYIRLKEIEVQGKALDKWNGVLPTQMIPGSTVPFINLSR